MPFDVARAQRRALPLAFVLIAGLGAGPALAASTVTYRYDALGRLISTYYPSGVCTVYAYDAAGNRIQYTTGASNPPVANAITVTAYEDLVSTFDPRAGAAGCGGAITVSSVTQPPAGEGSAVVASGGAGVVYTPPANWLGTAAFTYTLYDGHNYSSPGAVTIDVQTPTLPPIALSAKATYRNTIPPPNSVTPFINFAVGSLISDPYGYPLTITSVTNGQYGKGSINALTVTYTYDNAVESSGVGVSTTEPITYTVSDGHGHSASASLQATVYVFTNQ